MKVKKYIEKFLNIEELRYYLNIIIRGNISGDVFWI